jgi:cation:H+ antiporter
MIVAGAELFVGGIKFLAVQIGMPSLVLALVLAPVATELPEKFNSIIWIGKKKDTLALGNITGAMVFQSSIIPALGIMTTPWQLDGISLLSGLLVLSSSFILLISVLSTKELRANHLIFSGFFYLIFILVVCWAMN